VRGAGYRGHQPLKLDGVEEFDPIIPAEVLALVVPVVGIGLRIALLGIADEGALPPASLPFERR